jgi:hypothetical protein
LQGYNFIILFSFFSANNFVKKKLFFVPVYQNNGIKIPRVIILFLEFTLPSESTNVEVPDLSF